MFELKCKSHVKVKWCTLGSWDDSQPVMTNFCFEICEKTGCSKVNKLNTMSAYLR